MDYYISPYSKTSIIFRSTDEANDVQINQHKQIAESLGGKWNARLKGGAGWILPKLREKELRQALTPDQTPDSWQSMKDHGKSRLEQDKYRRAISEDEDSKEDQVKTFYRNFARSPVQSSSSSSNDDEYLPTPRRGKEVYQVTKPKPFERKTKTEEDHSDLYYKVEKLLLEVKNINQYLRKYPIHKLPGWRRNE